MELPDTILEVVTASPDDVPPLLAVCAGYEDGVWRHRQLSFDLLAWASDWILAPEELATYGPANGFELLGKALSRVYGSIDYERRGEVGELLLHIVLRKFLASSRLVSRLYFKDAANDTVKGFDAVHIVESTDSGGLELWLGESKFYTDLDDATSALLAELVKHLSTDYLRYEFAAIMDKVPEGHPHKSELQQLLARTQSLDSVFQRVVVPLFITYDSEVAGRHRTVTDAYRHEVEEELRNKWQRIATRLGNRQMPRSIRAYVLLMPMASKQALLHSFDERLKAWQTTTRV